MSIAGQYLVINPETDWHIINLLPFQSFCFTFCLTPHLRNSFQIPPNTVIFFCCQQGLQSFYVTEKSALIELFPIKHAATMEYTDTTKQQLLCEIERLPEVCLSELQNFIQYLQFKQASANSAVHHTLQPTDDPILRSCGFIDLSLIHI